MLKKFVAALVMTSVLAAPVSAGPMGPVAKQDAPPVAEALVVPVHGCHREPELGPGGWHVHRYDPRTGDPCRRFATASPRYVAPPPRYLPPPPPRRRPVCYQDCNYIGPIKQCRTVCR